VEAIVENLVNPWVLAYMLLLLFSVVFPRFLEKLAATSRESDRSNAKLHGPPLVGPGVQLETSRRIASREFSIFSAIALLAPFVLGAIAYLKYMPLEEESFLSVQKSLGTAFVFLFIWVSVSGTETAKAFLGGLAFRALMARTRPFQTGDRVTLDGFSGRVVEIGFFHVSLVTPDDDLVSIPTYQLWSKPLISTNAGNPASLCAIDFYLSPRADQDQRKKAEAIIRDAVQASIYYEPSKPLQTFCNQERYSIHFQAKAYVSSTYREFEFKDDVTKKALNAFDEHSIPLSLPKRHVE
jgi:small-conductance mechanosensitive channel